jgi:hypothetical protein
MEIIDHKWVSRQAAKLACIIYLISTGILVQAQTLKPTNNKGGYTFEEILLTDTKDDSIKVFGQAFNLKDTSAISQAEITLSCTTKITNATGEFEFKIKNNDLETNYLKIVALGFKTVETEFFPIDPGVGKEINFFLEEVDKPFINCSNK